MGSAQARDGQLAARGYNVIHVPVGGNGAPEKIHDSAFFYIPKKPRCLLPTAVYFFTYSRFFLHIGHFFLHGNVAFLHEKGPNLRIVISKRKNAQMTPSKIRLLRKSLKKPLCERRERPPHLFNRLRAAAARRFAWAATRASRSSFHRSLLSS